MIVIIILHGNIYWHNIRKEIEHLTLCIGLIWASEGNWKRQ